MTIEHDGIHMDVVDSYLRDILLADLSSDNDIDPIDIVPDDIWPCVLGSLVTMLQVALERLTVYEGMTTYQDEVDSWFDRED